MRGGFWKEWLGLGQALSVALPRSDPWGRLASVSVEVTESLRQIPSLREQREELRRRFALGEPRLREGESLEDALAPLPATGRDEEERRAVRLLGDLLAVRLSPGVGRLDLWPESGDTGYVCCFRGDSAYQVVRAMLQDRELSHLVAREAERTFGREVPRAPSERGAVVDVRALLRHSTVFAHAAARAARLLERAADEQTRRDWLSHQAGAAPDSVLERAVRDMDPGWAARRAGESAAELGLRVRERAVRALRLAWVSRTSPGERLALRLPVVEMERTAVRSPRVDEAMGEWFRAASYLALDSAQRAQLRTALANPLTLGSEASPQEAPVDYPREVLRLR